MDDLTTPELLEQLLSIQDEGPDAEAYTERAQEVREILDQRLPQGYAFEWGQPGLVYAAGWVWQVKSWAALD